MTPKGKRNRRIAFERAAVARGELGGRSATGWTVVGSRWSAVFFGTGAERRSAAGVEQALQSATFNVAADALTTTITAKDRISFLGQRWDIEGIAPIGVGPREIELTCTASQD